MENSQCAISTGGVSAKAAGKNLTLRVTVTFKAAFAGTKNVYVRARNQSAVTGDYVTLGTWTVPASQ